MKVLYVTQSRQISGAEHSLLTLLDALPDEVMPVVAAPEGKLAEALVARGIAHRAISAPDVSFRLHPKHTTTGLIGLARASLAVDAVARDERPDVLHANDTRAGLMAQLAARRRAPLVVSARDAFAEGRLGAVVRRVLASGASALVTNSDFVRADFADIEARIAVTTIHNAVDVARFDATRYDRAACRAALGITEATPLLGVVGQITPWKGQIDAIVALAELRAELPETELVIVGSAKFVAAGTRYDNITYERELRETAARLGLTDAVHFLGERDDVPAVMVALDVLLLPSWAEPFGRVCVEAMAMGVAVIATAVGGTREIITDGVDGLLVEPRRPELWAGAAHALLSDPERRAPIAEAGRVRARSQFTPERHAARMYDVYRAAFDGR